MQKRVVKKYLPLLILLLASIVIVVLWFREAKFFANAEDSMPFYSPLRTASLYGSVWQNNGFGYLLSFAIPRAPLMYFAAFFNLFFENFVVQALIFAFLIASAMIGVYYFGYRITKNRVASLVAGLFYFFNLYSMSQVWQRALYVGMFAWAYLPVYGYLLIQWLTGKKLRNLVLLLLSIWIYIRTFGQPSYVFAFITITIVISILLFFDKKTKVKKKGIIKRLLTFGILAIVFNIWWIYPFIALAGETYAGLTTSLQSFESLRGVSQYFPVSQIILLKQKFFFDSTTNMGLKQIAWGDWYERWFPITLSWSAFIVTAIGWLTMKRGFARKLLSILAIVGLFIAKGTNPPLGIAFFKFIFSNFEFTSALRNSYEKFGIIWLLPYSIFFGLGVYWIQTKVTEKIRFMVISLLTITFCGILVWPIWTGKLFPSYDWVKVPHYYQEANDFINLDSSDFRILMLPMIPGHSSRFSWGFRGSEPSVFLFDKVTISKKRELKYNREKYQMISQALLGSGDLHEELEEANVKYLVLRMDLDWKYLNTISPQELETIFNKNSSIKQVKSFGELIVYEVIGENTGFVEKNESIPTQLTLSYIRVSPMKYEVKVENVQDRYNLVLKQAYNDRWVARIDGKEIAGHRVIYDYANVWEVNKKGTYDIDIIFKVWPWE